jgi:hypothetical protein
VRETADPLTSWEVTSDSLALWLARILSAERLVVVKACSVPPGSTLAELGERGVLDARFHPWSRDAPFPIEVVDADDIDFVRNALLGGTSMTPLVAAASVLASGGGRPRVIRTRPRRKPAS